MVAFNGSLKNDCVKTHPPNVTTTSTSSPPTGGCERTNENSTKITFESPIEKSRQTRILIKTDTTHSRRIGLNVNTNVHLKPKKNYDCAHFIKTFFILLLAVYGVASYFDIQRLKNEIQVMKLQLKAIEDRIKLDVEMIENSGKAVERGDQVLLKMINNAIDNIKLQENNSKIKGNKEISKHVIVKREAEDVDDIERICSNCSSNGRIARSVNRGPLALHLRGAMPEITVRDGGIIAPWYIDKSSSGNFLLADGVVGERKGILEIVEEGLYYIYAQMFYLTSSSLNSYAINVQLGEGRGREDSVIAVCSAEAAITKLSELSCYTATVRYLRRGDRLYVTQRERNRRIIFRDNQSFLGLVLLNSHHPVNN